MSLTVIAIDGQGADTRDYCSLLSVSAGLIDVEKARLLTSDADAAHPDVECIAIDRLDYLAYSRFCVERLADYVDTDFCLCVQLDGFILNPALWDEDFLTYDFVGAPWSDKPHRPMQRDRNVGNGGFSLRSQRYLRLARECRWQPNWDEAPIPDRHQGNEDYFLNILNRDFLIERGIRFPTQAVAARFSIQSGDKIARGQRLSTVFGFHGKGLVGKARWHTRRHGIVYPHLENLRSSIFPLRY